jgi:hypothetical protein
MNEQKFKSEMRRAETMRRMAEPERAEYWAGYIRGLRRAYHGKKFGTADEHKQWMDAANSDDEMRKQRGLGYRDGLAFDEISSRIGRPSICDEPTVSVGIRLPESVAAKIPEPRSEWIRNLIVENLPD